MFNLVTANLEITAFTKKNWSVDPDFFLFFFNQRRYGLAEFSNCDIFYLKTQYAFISIFLYAAILLTITCHYFCRFHPDCRASIYC
jgi:hypothetical protein